MSWFLLCVVWDSNCSCFNFLLADQPYPHSKARPCFGIGLNALKCHWRGFWGPEVCLHPNSWCWDPYVWYCLVATSSSAGEYLQHATLFACTEGDRDTKNRSTTEYFTLESQETERRPKRPSRGWFYIDIAHSAKLHLAQGTFSSSPGLTLSLVSTLEVSSSSWGYRQSSSRVRLAFSLKSTIQLFWDTFHWCKAPYSYEYFPMNFPLSHL